MKPDELIPLALFCQHHQVDLRFFEALGDYGLVEIITVSENTFLPAHQLQPAEQLIRLHHDLNINLEGLDAIAHLLKRINELQHELTRLRNQLGSY